MKPSAIKGNPLKSIDVILNRALHAGTFFVQNKHTGSMAILAMSLCEIHALTIEDSIFEAISPIEKAKREGKQ